MKPAQRGTQESGKTATAASKKFKGFADDELAAMRERTRELKAGGESAVLVKKAVS